MGKTLDKNVSHTFPLPESQLPITPGIEWNIVTLLLIERSCGSIVILLSICRAIFGHRDRNHLLEPFKHAGGIVCPYEKLNFNLEFVKFVPNNFDLRGFFPSVETNYN